MRTSLIIVLALSLAACTSSEKERLIAETIYTNGKVYTVDETNIWAEAVALKNGRILKVGSNEDINKFKGKTTEIVDLKGKLVLPGLIDAHSHPGVAAYDLFNKWELPSTFDNPTWEQLESKLKEGQKAMQDAPWFLGHSYTKTAWPAEKYNRWYLDGIFGEQPVFIYMEGQHESIANSKALEIAGLNKDTPDPKGGVLGRDPKTGELNGILYEDFAASLVERHIPPISIEKKTEGLVRAMALMHVYGYTGAFDAQYGNESTLASYGKILESGALPMHIKVVVDAFGYGGPEKALTALEVTAIFDKYTIPNSMRAVKVQMDGSIEGHTSYMLEGYSDRPDFNSPLMTSKENFSALMKDYDSEGLQILTHAIGDGSVRVNLNLYEELIKSRGSNELRHKIDHAVVVSNEDIPRFAELGIPVCPLNVVHQDMPYTRQLIELLGSEAKQNILPIGRLLKSGAIVAGTTDWPGAPEANAFNLIEIMTTRKGLRETGNLIGLLEDKLTVEQAVKCFTWNSAWTMGIENETGSIEEGKWADFIIVDQDIFEIPKKEIGSTKVLYTVFKGAIVFDRSIHNERVEDISTEEIWYLLKKYQSCQEH